MIRIIDIPQNSSIQRHTISVSELTSQRDSQHSTLSKRPAVFLICSRINGQPANPRYVGSTLNFQKTVLELDHENIPNCVKEFIQSTKTKEIIYELVEMDDDEVLFQKRTEWTKRFNPMCPENQNIHKPSTSLEINPVEEEEYYLPTHKQHGKVLISRLKERCTNDLLKRELGAFNLSKQVVVPDIDQAKLEAAFRSLLHRHEALRTMFVVVENEIKQKVISIEKFALPIFNYQVANDVEHTNTAASLISREIDFFSELPITLSVIQKPDSDISILLCLNHIAGDFHSLTILQEDFFNFYHNPAFQHKEDKRSQIIQLKDYAIWENSIVNNNTYSLYWNTLLSGNLPKYLLNNFVRSQDQQTEVKTSYTETLKTEGQTNFQTISKEEVRRISGISHRLSSFRGASFTFSVTTENYADLKKIAILQSSTVYHVLISAILILLHKISQQDDIIMATECNTRNHKLYRTVGWLSNTIFIRQLITGEHSVSELIHQTSSQIIESLNYSAYPIEKVLQSIDRSIDSFQTIYLNHQNLSDTTSEIFKDFQPAHTKDEIPYFDIDIFLTEYSNGTEVVLRYKEELFDPLKIELLANHFQKALIFMSKNLNNKISLFTPSMQ